MWNSENFDEDSLSLMHNKKSEKFLCATFQLQMRELKEELESCGVHFVRCIKPNELKKKELLEPKFIMQQIRYLGVFESIKIRKQGY